MFSVYSTAPLHTFPRILNLFLVVGVSVFPGLVETSTVFVVGLVTVVIGTWLLIVFEGDTDILVNLLVVIFCFSVALSIFLLTILRTFLPLGLMICIKSFFFTNC